MAGAKGGGEGEYLCSAFPSTSGGVMTEEAGAITGDLELLTRELPERGGIEAMVRYAGARDLYTVAGGPVRAGKHGPAHERILGALTTPGEVSGGNELPVSL